MEPDSAIRASLAVGAPVLSVIIPAYNERATLDEVIRRVERLACAKEILIVDDGSTDGTAEYVRKLADQAGVQALFHSRNLGKGAAVRTALAQATGAVIVVQDADREYDPADIERLIEPILNGQADVVYGSRFSQCGRANSKSEQAGGDAAGLKDPRLHRAANWLLTWLSNRFTGLALSDMETCYKAMRREVAAELVLRENRFGFEPEFTAKIARNGWRVVEAPISYNARSRSAGKKIGLLDGLRAIWCIVRYSCWD